MSENYLKSRDKKTVLKVSIEYFFWKKWFNRVLKLRTTYDLENVEKDTKDVENRFVQKLRARPLYSRNDPGV